jgi:hypothetical protein
MTVLAFARVQTQRSEKRPDRIKEVPVSGSTLTRIEARGLPRTFDLLIDVDGNLIEEPIPEDEWDFPESREFIAWLFQQADRNDPIGDLASDLIADAAPETPTYMQLLYGVARGCAGAQRALSAALRQYADVRVFA